MTTLFEKIAKLKVKSYFRQLISHTFYLIIHFIGKKENVILDKYSKLKNKYFEPFLKLTKKKNLKTMRTSG